MMQSEIKKWGNSAAIRIPSKMLAQLQLDISSTVTIEVVDGKLEIVPTKLQRRHVKLPFSEADLLQGLDPQSAHADALAEPTHNEIDN